MRENCKLMKMELDAWRRLRADDRAAAAATENAIRKEERIVVDAIRREGHTDTEAWEDKIRQGRKDEQVYELQVAMLQMQLNLSPKKTKK